MLLSDMVSLVPIYFVLRCRFFLFHSSLFAFFPFFCTPVCRLHLHSLTHSLIHTLILTHTLTPPFAHSLTLTQTLSHTLILTHTLIYTHSYTHTNTHSYEKSDAAQQLKTLKARDETERDALLETVRARTIETAFQYDMELAIQRAADGEFCPPE